MSSAGTGGRLTHGCPRTEVPRKHPVAPPPDARRQQVALALDLLGVRHPRVECVRNVPPLHVEDRPPDLGFDPVLALLRALGIARIHQLLQRHEQLIHLLHLGLPLRSLVLQRLEVGQRSFALQIALESLDLLLHERLDLRQLLAVFHLVHAVLQLLELAHDAARGLAAAGAALGRAGPER